MASLCLPRPRGQASLEQMSLRARDQGLSVFLSLTSPDFPTSILGIKITSWGMTVTGRLVLSPQPKGPSQDGHQAQAALFGVCFSNRNTQAGLFISGHVQGCQCGVDVEARVGAAWYRRRGNSPLALQFFWPVEYSRRTAA